MRVPEFIKEVVWSLYPPRYRQIADKSFFHSIKYMTKILFFAFIVASIFFIPSALLLPESVESGLSKFGEFSFSASINQSDKVSIPSRNPWVVVDLNNNVSLSKEFFVVDESSVQYRLLKVNNVPREQFRDIIKDKNMMSSFIGTVLLLMLPGIALLLFIRMWIKYFVLILVAGTFFFLICELSKFRLKWKQMLNVVAYALTPIIFLEVISAGISTKYLIPVLRFLGINVYLISLLILSVVVIMGVIGYHIEARKK